MNLLGILIVSQIRACLACVTLYQEGPIVEPEELEVVPMRRSLVGVRRSASDLPSPGRTDATALQTASVTSPAR